MGKDEQSNSKTKGYFTLGLMLVIAKITVVPERWLKTILLITNTGRFPPCSLPRMGFKSA